MNFQIVPAHEVALAEQASVFNLAFTGYLAGWTEMDAAVLARFLCAQGADLYYSRFVRTNEAFVSFGYINRTGNVSRLAAMGTIPDARRTGAAAQLLSQLLKEATICQDQAMVLEVFEQNLPALSLYRRYGFEPVSRLFGWRRSAKAEVLEKQLTDFTEIPMLNAIETSNASEFPNLPWQISRHAAVKVPAGHAFGNDRACIVVGDTALQSIRVHAFFAAHENWNELRSILAAVIRQFPNHEFSAPQIFPEQFGASIFEPLGFAREPLNQLLMRRELSAAEL
jgi:ribosomal protein S18 acetylase RimI-like enzyme